MLSAVARRGSTRREQPSPDFGPNTVADALYDACIAELDAIKPGNVGLHGDGHGMCADDFVKSARAIATPLTAIAATVGQRICAAIRATREVVACNTNLGIVLLCAPLAHAALNRTAAQTLRAALAETLRALDVDDAALAFEAIRLANPGGLGRAEHLDVREPPTANLLAAMTVAADRDSIARQYANGFADVFDLGIASLNEARARGWPRPWAVSACYLNLLARFFDTHIARKYGEDAARGVSSAAQTFATRLQASAQPQTLLPELAAWDAELKRDGFNPGATADLTVASLFALRLERL